VKKPAHWSWSSLDTFEQCPRRWKHKYIDRLPDPPGEALQRGIAVHSALEAALKAKGAEVEDGGAWLNNIVDTYRAFGSDAEASIYVDKSWSEVKPEPGRYIPTGCRTMAKLDVLSVKDAFFADWKTGKIYPEKHEAQARLYATVLASVTGKMRWDTDLVYVDQGVREMLTFEFDDISKEQREWDARAAKIDKETKFPKKPSRLCGWCPFHKKKGGPCDG
jgi:RecB family exonuclease